MSKRSKIFRNWKVWNFTINTITEVKIIFFKLLNLIAFITYLVRNIPSVKSIKGIEPFLVRIPNVVLIVMSSTTGGFIDCWNNKDEINDNN